MPLEGCSKEEAISFLTVLDSVDPASSIDDATGLSTAKLAHRYGMKVSFYKSFQRYSIPVSMHVFALTI